MREDMAKVVTERPRAGARLKAPKGCKRDDQRIPLEEKPTREKIRQKWKAAHFEKRFTDVLGPIYGYLLSKVGEPWDSVWSEVCKHLPANNTNTSHVRDHVLQFVETHVILVNGVPCYGEGMNYGEPIQGYYRAWTMYVDPVDRKLKRIKNKKQRRWRLNKKSAGIPVPGEPLKQYHNINGVWYVITLEAWKRDPNTYHDVRWDVAYKQFFDDSGAARYYGGTYVATEKRQLNSREIVRAGLREC